MGIRVGMSLTLRVVAWLGTAGAAFLLLAQPVSTDAQLSLSLTAIFVMALIWKFGKSQVARQMFLAIASFIVIRYIYWRVTSTLPPTSDPVGLTIGSILLMAEL